MCKNAQILFQKCVKKPEFVFKNVYRHITSQLSKDNHKFQVSLLGHTARFREYKGCEEWLKDAGVINIASCFTSIGSSAFLNCTSLTIYCEAESQPSGWNSNWNSSYRPVYWGYKEETE